MMENENARYLYSVVRTGEQHQLGNIGIEDEAVYTIPYNDIAAVVHRCRPLPYDTDDKTLAEEWILEHSYVIDQVTKVFGTVLPFAFDVIIRGDDSVVVEWLKENYKPITGDLERVRWKSEYSIQVYCNYEDLVERTQRLNQELKDLQKEMERQPIGKAYLLRKSLDLKRKGLISKEVGRLKDQFCSRIKPLVEEMKMDGKKCHISDKYKKMELLASCNCLVCDENIELLGEVLDEIQEEEGFAVKFTGPWAPFNFVNLMEAR